MRCEDHVLQPDEWTVGGKRLGGEHVQPRRGDDTLFERLDEGWLVDHATAGDVDQHGSRLHGSECLGADQPSGLRGQRAREHNSVSRRQQLIELHAADTKFRGCLGSRVRGR